jgi:hypothetical protein
VLGAPTSDTNDFVWRDACVSSTQVNRPFGTKRSHLHFEKPRVQEEILSKTA